MQPTMLMGLKSLKPDGLYVFAIKAIKAVLHPLGIDEDSQKFSTIL